MTRLGFLLFYVLALIPTYILPYFGSNSFFGAALKGAVTTSMGIKGPALGWSWTILHVAALLLCIYVTHLRGVAIGKKALVALPILAAVFDMAPVLNAIPLVPTILHVIALAMVTMGQDLAEEPPPTRLTAHPLLGIAAIVGGSIVLAGLNMAAATIGASLSAKEMAERQAKQQAERASVQHQVAQPSKRATIQTSPFDPQHKPGPSMFQPPLSAPEIAPPSVDPAAEQRRAEAARMAAEKEAEQRRNEERADRVNAILIKRESMDMAKRYIESFIDFAQVGDLPGAVSVYGGSAEIASTLQSCLQTLEGRYTIQHNTPLFREGRPGHIYIHTKVVSIKNPIRDCALYTKLTLSPEGKFVYIK